MFKYIKTASTILLIIFFASSCQKERVTYTGEPGKESGVYFYSVASFRPDGTPISYRDSLVFSFQNDLETTTEKIINVPVKVIGTILEKDRYFKIKVVGGNAVEGVDFEKLEEQYEIASKAASINLPITLNRTSKLTSESLYFDLQLVESDDFKLLLPFLLNIGNNQKMDATKFRVRFSEIITRPSYWDFADSYFGEFSVKKFKMLNDLMSWTTGDWRYAGFSGRPVQSGKFTYAANLFRNLLQEAADNNHIIYDEDGITPMQLAPAFAVIY